MVESVENLKKQALEIIPLIAEKLVKNKKLLCSAESCTGGLLAAVCTEIEGSSNWFSHTIVTYSNAAKQSLLGVPAELLTRYGAVSEQVAAAMVKGIGQSNDLLAIAITGLAGPGGETKNKKVGTVCFGFKYEASIKTYTKIFAGNRQQVRWQAVNFALNDISNSYF